MTTTTKSGNQPAGKEKGYVVYVGDYLAMNIAKVRYGKYGEIYTENAPTGGRVMKIQVLEGVSNYMTQANRQAAEVATYEVATNPEGCYTGAIWLPLKSTGKPYIYDNQDDALFFGLKLVAKASAYHGVFYTNTTGDVFTTNIANNELADIRVLPVSYDLTLEQEDIRKQKPDRPRNKEKWIVGSKGY